MKKVRLIVAIGILLAVGYSLAGCGNSTGKGSDQENTQILEKALEYNSPKKSQERDMNITVNSEIKYKDGKVIKGKEEYIINTNPRAIKMISNGSEGGMTVFHFVNGSSVDMYHSDSENNNKFVEEKDIPIENTSVPATLQLGTLNGKIEDYKVLKDEKVNGRETLKISYHSKLEEFNSMLKKIIKEGTLDEKTIEKNKNLQEALDRIKKGKESYYWIDKKDYKVLKFDIDSTDEELIFHYLSNNNDENIPVSHINIGTVLYDNVQKVEKPKI